jgi:simple sugar transport system permease protein
VKTEALSRKTLIKNPKNRTLLIILVISLMIMVFSMPGKFFTAANFQSMASQFPEFGFLALAMMLAMITGGIDLSIVSIANFTGVLSAIILTKVEGLPTGVAIAATVVVTIVVSALCGLFNGALIARVGVPPILATLGTQGLFMGISIVITKGYSISGFPDAYMAIGNGNVAGIPISFVMFIIAAFCVHLFLTRTRQGFNMFMVGSSPVVSRFSGVDNTKVIVKTYIMTAILAGLSSIIMTSRANSMRPGYGTAYILEAILVAVLGGVDPDGGFGNVPGLIMAILILQITQSGLNILAFSPFFKKFIWGFALLAVMVINYLVQVNSSKSRVLKKKKQAQA